MEVVMRSIWSAAVGTVGLAIALGSVAAVAQSAPQCGARAGVIAGLENRYSEKPVAAGVDNNGALVEVLAAPEGDTWTILVSMPNGVSCVVAAGESWQSRDRVAQVGPGT
jgi:hypothetical protein